MSYTENWNPLDFQCPLRCNYCPEKGYSEIPVLADGWESISRHYAIWACPNTDLFCDEVPDALIEKILMKASEHHKGFIFSTKNPSRYWAFIDKFPPWSYITATVESDIDHGCSLAPPPLERLEQMRQLKLAMGSQYPEVCLSIQPVMEFTDDFAEAVLNAGFDQVSISYELTGIEGFPTPEFDRVLTLAKTLATEKTMVQLNCVAIHPDTHLEDWPLRIYNGELT